MQLLSKVSKQFSNLQYISTKTFAAAVAISQQYENARWGVKPVFIKKKPYKKISVFQEFTNLSKQFNSVNLGQGLPDIEEKHKIVQQFYKQVQFKQQNYFQTPEGEARLLEQLHRLYSPLFKQEINPNSDIVVSNGATECIQAAFESFINYGDEVILIEPYFEPYAQLVKMAGGIPRFVPLRFPKNCKSSDEIQIDFDKLKATINPKTKMILLNTPQNPTGKVFSEMELKKISSLVLKQKHCYVISDEVYEFLTFSKKQHLRIANIPGMDERTITISSAAKTFSYTEQKIGWCIAKSHLIKPIQMALSFSPQKVSSIIQDTMAQVIDAVSTNKSNYLDNINSLLENRKNMLKNAMLDKNLKVIDADSGYFLTLDIRNIKFPRSYTNYCDYEFAYWLTKHHGITVIPLSSFYSEPHKQKSSYYVRCCFVKSEEQIQKVSDRLKNLQVY